MYFDKRNIKKWQSVMTPELYKRLANPTGRKLSTDEYEAIKFFSRRSENMILEAPIELRIALMKGFLRYLEREKRKKKRAIPHFNQIINERFQLYLNGRQHSAIVVCVKSEKVLSFMATVLPERFSYVTLIKDNCKNIEWSKMKMLDLRALLINETNNSDMLRVSLRMMPDSLITNDAALADDFLCMSNTGHINFMLLNKNEFENFYKSLENRENKKLWIEMFQQTYDVMKVNEEKLDEYYRLMKQFSHAKGSRKKKKIRNEIMKVQNEIFSYVST